MAQEARYWMSGVRAKDDFGDAITDEFIDGRSNTPGGLWGIFTPRSWLQYGCGTLGTGFGQRYERQSDGRFLKVEG